MISRYFELLTRLRDLSVNRARCKDLGDAASLGSSGPGTAQITVRLPLKVIESLDANAASLGVTRPAFIRMLLKKYMDSVKEIEMRF